MNRSRDTAHAQWLQKHYQWYPMGDVRTHNSRTGSRRIFRLGARFFPRLISAVANWMSTIIHGVACI